MGLKSFRARLWMNKRSKVPELTGLYRRVSYSESDVSSTMQKNAPLFRRDVSAKNIDSNETSQDDSSTKSDVTDKLSSSTINEMEERANQTVERRSINDSNTLEQSLTDDKELNKINENQDDHASDTKNRISPDNEMLI